MNVRATDLETADYLSGERRNFTSSSVIYQPNYNLYGNAPVSGYDNTVLFNQCDQTTMVEDGGSLVDGKEISLVTLSDGSGNVLSRLNLTGDAGYKVDWSADDKPSDVGDLERVEILLINQRNGHIADRATYDVSGSDTASDTAELVDENGEDNLYRIVARVEDQGNRHDKDYVTDTADGSNP